MERQIPDYPTYVTVEASYTWGDGITAKVTLDIEVSKVSILQNVPRGPDHGFAIVDGAPITVESNFKELRSAWKRYLMLRTLAANN